MRTLHSLALSVTLAGGLWAAAASAAGPGTLKFDQSSISVAESVGTVNIAVERSQGEDGAVSVTVSSVGGSATPGADYQPVSQVLQWANGDGLPKMVQVAIVDDAQQEGAETISLSLSGATGGAAIDPARSSFTITINANDGGTPPPPPPPPPGGCEPGDDSCAGGAFGTFKFSEQSFVAYETGGVAVISVERSHGESGAVSVSYATSNGTATAGADYTATSGSLSWGSGDGATKTFTVPILDDQLAEGPETVQIRLSNPTGGAAISASRGSVILTIVDAGGDTTPPGCEPGDDSCGGGSAAGVLKFDEASFQVHESQGVATIRVERSRGQSGAVSVAYAAAAGSATAGVDFEPVSGILSWGSGDGLVKTFTVPIHPDNRAEGTETVTLTLSNPTGGATIDLQRGTSTLSIIDDDGSTAPCEPGDDHLCLLGGRFRAQINFRTPNVPGGIGRGTGVSLSDQSGAFWFFDPANAEMLIKVIDACSYPGASAHWVFFSATTNVDFTLTVTDTRTGVSKQYFNPLGKSAEPIQDIFTFTSCQ